MTTMQVLPRDGEWTIADLELLPTDDGLRYELVDGTLLVSSAPSKAHQRAVGNLHLALRADVPGHLEVFLAPTDYQPTSRRSLQPDLLVVRRDDPGGKAVTTPLDLAVEVLSPSSLSIDRVLKRELYRQAGVAHYWLVDPLVPAVECWTLTDDSYLLSGTYGPDDVLAVDAPYKIAFAVRDLHA